MLYHDTTIWPSALSHVCLASDIWRWQSLKVSVWNWDWDVTPKSLHSFLAIRPQLDSPAIKLKCALSTRIILSHSNIITQWYCHTVILSPSNFVTAKTCFSDIWSLWLLTTGWKPTLMSHGSYQWWSGHQISVACFSVDSAAKQIWTVFCCCNNWALVGNLIPSNLLLSHTQVFGCPPQRIGWIREG